VLYTAKKSDNTGRLTDISRYYPLSAVVQHFCITPEIQHVLWSVAYVDIRRGKGMNAGHAAKRRPTVSLCLQTYSYTFIHTRIHITQIELRHRSSYCFRMVLMRCSPAMMCVGHRGSVERWFVCCYQRGSDCVLSVRSVYRM